MREFVDRSFERLAAVDGRYFAVGFFLLLLTYTLALLVEALGYSSDARLFPLIVGVPLVLLTVAKILLLLLSDRIDLRLVGLFDDVGGMELSSTSAAVDVASQYRRELAMTLWVVALVALTYLFGNYAAIVLFVFAFIAVHERDLVRAAVATVATFAVVYLLFDQVLGASLWRGVVPLGGFLP